MHRSSIRRSLLVALSAVSIFAGCGSGEADAPTGTTAETAAGTAAETGAAEPVTLRLGYFPNITHATALVGVERGIFAEHLADNVTFETATFNAGGEAIEALFADAIDASYIGPNPAINGFAQSDGEALRIISGATAGGAFLVVTPDITDVEQLRGATLATPALGNTQDVALRSWLKENGLTSDETGGGDVSIVPQENSATLEAFKAGDIDGAWVPEPWATRLIQEGGGTVLVDEADLWPDGQYVTTHLIVATTFLDAHPDVVKQLLEGHVAANEFVNANPAEAQKLANDQIEKITQKRVSDAVLTIAWANLTFTNDPVASSLTTAADNAIAIGLLDPVDLTGIYDLTILGSILSEVGLPAIKEP